jgi:hypothetical protein
VEIGLKEAYGEDDDLKKWFSWCISLAFIPGKYKSQGTKKRDLQRNITILKAKNVYLNVYLCES